MMRSQQSEPSLTKQSNVFRLFGFVAAVGFVAVGAGALAMGLIVPGWDIFKISPKVPAPAKALASTASSSSANSVSANATAPQGVEMIVRADAPSKQSDEPTTSSLGRMPAVNMQDAGSKAKDEPLSDSNVPTPPVTVAPKQPPMNSAIGATSQESDTPVVTSGIAAAIPSSAGAEPRSSPDAHAEPKPPTITSPRDSRPRQSVQNFAPTNPAHKARSPSGPTIGQRMWYK